MSHRKSLLTLAFAALALTLSLEASALLRIGSGGSSSTKTCPDGSKVPSDSTCPGSTLGGSLVGVYTGFGGPGSPPPLFPLPGGPTVALKCTQGALECINGLPAIQIVQEVTWSRGSKTATLTDVTKTWAGLGFPAASPENTVRVQTAGFANNRNNGAFTVVGRNGRVLTLVERPYNDTSTGLTAVADGSFVFTDLNGNPGQGKAYLRKFQDPVADAELTCVLNEIGDCIDAIATISGGFGGTFSCNSTGSGAATRLVLPCTVVSNATRDANSARYDIAADEHNIPECGSGSDPCVYVTGTSGLKVNNGFCKKYLPAVDPWGVCDQWLFTISAGESISTMLQRTFNGGPGEETVTTAHRTNTNAQGEIEVEVSTGPSMNPSQGGVQHVNVSNQAAADLSGIIVSSVVLRFSNSCAVDNTGSPNFSPQGGVFEFVSTEVACAYSRATGDTPIESGTQIPINLFGEYASGGAVSGSTATFTTGSTFDANVSCQPVNLPKCQ